jgi:hypothetical protein
MTKNTSAQICFVSRWLAPLALALSCASSTAFGQTPFTEGDLVVSTYGVGGGFIDGVPTPISLLEFTTSGNYVMTDTLPTSDSGNNFGIVGEYGSSSEANLQLSANGQSLLIAGYQADASYAGIGSPGGLGYSNENGDALAQSNADLVPRLIADVGYNGVANISTQFNDIYNQNNPRSVWSANGTVFYVAGQGNSTNDQGIFTVKAGSNTVTGSPSPTPISSNTGLAIRIVSEFNGNLYYSTDVKNAATGIFEYTGVPTTSAAVATQILPANNGKTGSSEVFYSPDDFYFANTSTLYVADTGDPKNKGLGDGGIQKWSLISGDWTLDYTLTPSTFIQNYNDKTSSATDGEVGFESLTGEIIGGNVDLFAVSYTIADADADGLYTISDPLDATTETGEDADFDEIATAPGVGDDSTPTAVGGDVFKSVSFAPVPEPSTYALLFGAASLGLIAWKRRKNTQS